jgi:hypothetical protein
MAPSPRHPVTAVHVRRFFEDHLPCALCNACVAFEFEISLEQAKEIAVEVTGSPGYVREDSKCDGCGRSIEVISVGRTRRQRP